MVSIIPSIACDNGVNQDEIELKLSDYLSLFRSNVMIVVGGNASQIDLNSAGNISKQLKDNTGNEAIIKTDPEASQDDKANHNLIIVGTPDSNSVINELYELTDATRVKEAYPVEIIGFLEILENPWNPDNALLIVSGNYIWGIKEAASVLNHPGDLTDSHVALFDLPEINKKIGSQLLFQIEQKEPYLEQTPTPNELARLEKYGIRADNLYAQGLAIYFYEEPTDYQVKEIQDLGVSLNPDKFMRDVDNPPSVFILAEMPVNKSILYEIANKSYVLRLVSSEDVVGLLMN